ncbi:MAG TPA: biosynthetic-type acetolactate synthase large subunit [Armatimonadota bacterium]|jgi:acetolactate synthase-1/2/3 large subunit
MKMNGAEALVEQLKREGVEIIFGYPGGAALPIYDALYGTTGITHILVRHEQGAGHMAEGYARASGRVGSCLATSGPGATNLVTPLADALMDSTPIVAITAQVASPMIGKDAFQEADVTGITMNCTKHNYLVKDATKVADTVAQAFTISRTGRPGPVLIDVPKDMLLTEVDYDPEKVVTRPRSYTVDYPVDPESIDAAAELIAKAERPVLYVGGGVINAGAASEIDALVRKTNIPITTTLMGKGAFDETDPLSLGMLGMHGSVASNWAVRDCDLLIAIGARFDDRVTGKIDEFVPHATIIHADIDPAEFGKVKNPHLQLLGDAKAVAGALVQAVALRDRSVWNDRVEGWMAEHPFDYPRDDGALHSQYVLDELWKATNGNALVVTDVGQHQMWAAQFYKVKRPRQFITSGGLGTMGYGLPASIGAQFACPNDEVWLITGDGSIQMCIQELIVAVVNKLPIKILILNNKFLGMVRQWQAMFLDGRYSETDMEQAPDFVKLAEAYGAASLRCDKAEDVVSTLEAARNITDRPTVIDMQVLKEGNVFPMIPAGSTVHNMILRAPTALEAGDLDKANIPG